MQVSAATSHIFGSFLAKAESEPDLEVCVQTRAKEKKIKDESFSLQHKQSQCFQDFELVDTTDLDLDSQ